MEIYSRLPREVVRSLEVLKSRGDVVLRDVVRAWWGWDGGWTR